LAASFKFANRRRQFVDARPRTCTNSPDGIRHNHMFLRLIRALDGILAGIAFLMLLALLPALMPDPTAAVNKFYVIGGAWIAWCACRLPIEFHDSLVDPCAQQLVPIPQRQLLRHRDDCSHLSAQLHHL
jgi:hypothetical protein